MSKRTVSYYLSQVGDTHYTKLDIFSLENRMENIANAYYIEKRNHDRSLLRLDSTLLDKLKSDYNEIALHHFDRTGGLNYCYYVI